MLIMLAVLVLSVVIHEYMHGFIADHFGDPTPRASGRLTLNPIPHIDLFGSILLPLFLIVTGSPFLIGWAKPVPIDPFNLRDPRRDMALIALAGPASNIALAFIFSAILHLTLSFQLSSILLSVFEYGIIINLSLALLNILPVSPLDGFKVVGGILPHERAQEWYSLERYGFIFLLILILPITGQSMLSYIMEPFLRFFLNLLLPASLMGAMII